MSRPSQGRALDITVEDAGRQEKYASAAVSAITKPQARLEKRGHAREALNLKVYFQVFGGELASCTLDMSQGGLRITLPKSLGAGMPLSLHMSFGDLCVLKLSGQIVHCQSADGSYVVGIKFAAVRELSQKILSSAIQELKENKSTLVKSFATIHASEDHLAVEASSIAREATQGISDTGPQSVVSEPTQSAGRNVFSTKAAIRKSRKFTPNPPWVEVMNQHLDPFRQAIWQSKLVQETKTGELSLAQVRGWSIQFYPFIEYFPQFMATYLAKAEDPASRTFLIDNLRVEKRHADQWIDMAVGFGVPKPELFETPIIPEVEALTHWMWSIANRGSLVEAVAAANFAIEGVTQGIAERMVKGFSKYHGSEGVHLPKKAYYWMEAHAHYDDLHPYEALEVIKLHAHTEELQQKVTHAAQRSLEYLFRALEACYWAYATEPTRC